MATVPDKETYYRLARLGLLGNTLRQWETPSEMRDSGYSGLVAVRSKRPGGVFTPNLQGLAAAAEWFLRTSYGEQCVLAEMDTGGGRRMLTGFVWRDEVEPMGYVLEYSERDELVRHAMRMDHHIKHVERGLRAIRKMREHMTEYDWDDVSALFDMYPDAIVEFTCFANEIGSLPGRRAIIWEVRDY